MATKDFSACDLKTVKVNRGEPVKAAFCLQNISTNYVNLEAAIADTCSVVELGDGENKVRLSFYFEPEEMLYSTAGAVTPNKCDHCGDTPDMCDHCGGTPDLCNHCGGTPNVCDYCGTRPSAPTPSPIMCSSIPDSYCKTLSFCCTVLSGGGGRGRELKFIVELSKLKANLQYEGGVMSEKMITIGGDRNRQKIIVGKRILPYVNAKINQNGSITNEQYLYASTNDLCFGISVTQIESTGQGEVADRGGELAVGSPEVTLAQNLKDMFNSHEFFSDLKLQTKDGVETSTHKFIVAARSPVLKEIIEKESAKESFNGTIKIQDFNAKPIIAILHWMYSGRLSDKTGNVIEDVVVAAKKYQLTDMMKQLDKEMITVCNTGNMFQLFEAARQNHLPIAMLQISAFIKENIGTMVPHA